MLYRGRIHIVEDNLDERGRDSVDDRLAHGNKPGPERNPATPFRRKCGPNDTWPLGNSGARPAGNADRDSTDRCRTILFVGRRLWRWLFRGMHMLRFPVLV
jgi:hypothetical protein